MVCALSKYEVVKKIKAVEESVLLKWHLSALTVQLQDLFYPLGMKTNDESLGFVTRALGGPFSCRCTQMLVSFCRSNTLHCCGRFQHGPEKTN